MSKPLIAVSGRRWVGERVHGFPSNFAGAEVDLILADYSKCVAAAGGIALSVPFESDPHEVMARLDGLVLTGGADVDPASYGGPADGFIGELEPERDAYETALFRAAVAHGKPVLAICRGAQLVNVALGGTLVSDLDDEGGCEHPAWGSPRHELTHPVTFVDGSAAAKAFGALTVHVNTLHHQSVDRPGEGVLVTGHAPDGVIEAYEVPDQRVFAVQWHPELVLEQPDPCFLWLTSEAKREALS